MRNLHDKVAVITGAASGIGAATARVFVDAGAVGAWTFVDSTDVDEWDAAFTLLARSAFLGVKHATRVMRPTGSGSIINVSSVAGIRSGFGPHPYSAAKAAVRQLTRTAAAELAEHGIRVNALVPGGVATRIVGHGAGLRGANLDNSVDAVRADLAKFQPIPRAGEGDDLASAAAFLASDAASFITGQDLQVDGGLTLGRRWAPAYREQAAAAARQAP